MIHNNQIELPFTQADADKLDSILPGAEPNAPTASKAEAEAGLDNGKMMTPLRVSQAIAAQGGGGGGGGEANVGANLGAGQGLYKDKLGITLEFKSLVAGTGITITPGTDTITLASISGGLYLNNSGSQIPAMSVVWQDTSGNIRKFTTPSVESQIKNTLGLLLTVTDNNTQGAVVLAGLIKNVTTAFNIGDLVYLSKFGGMTAAAPDIGVGGFSAGDFVVQIGNITKNSDNPLQKDLNLAIIVRGQL